MSRTAASSPSSAGWLVVRLNDELELLDPDIVNPAGLITQDGLEFSLRLVLGHVGRESAFFPVDERGERHKARLYALPVWEHVFVTSQGSAYARFRRALNTGSPVIALAAAHASTSSASPTRSSSAPFSAVTSPLQPRGRPLALPYAAENRALVAQSQLQCSRCCSRSQAHGRNRLLEHWPSSSERSATRRRPRC